MTKTEALKLIGEYCDELNRRGPLKGRSYDTLHTFDVLKDAKGMAARWPEDGSKAKAMRWLGYLQGMFVCAGYCTLEDVKEHSRRKHVITPECTCEYQETCFTDNPRGHISGCPCWGTDVPLKGRG